MKRSGRWGLAVALLLVVGADARASAQEFAACEASWLDEVRLLAVLQVELTALEPLRREAILALSECEEVSARLSVMWPDEHHEAWTVRLETVAPEARSRLLALMFVELLRRGPRAAAPPGLERVSPSMDTAPADPRPPVGNALAVAEEPSSAAPDVAPTLEETDAITESVPPVDPPLVEDVEADALPAPPTPAEPSTPKWFFALSGGGRGYVQRETYAVQLRLRVGYWRLFVDGSFLWSSRSDPIGTAEMQAGAVGLGVRLLEFGTALRFAVNLRGEVAYQEISGEPNFVDPREFVVGGFTSGLGLGVFSEARLELPISIFVASTTLEVGYQRGLAVTADGRSLGGLDGLAVGLLLDIGVRL
ncbi:MAG: hypothetical protein AAGF12_17100 [Myxococcota bacterium]